MPRNTTAIVLERLGFVLNSPSGNIEQLKQLLAELEQTGLQKEKMINCSIQRYNGRTAVHLAASNGLFDCLELLLKSGGNPNAQSSPTDLSQTPLHLASSKGYSKCIQILLDYGANMNIKNTHRETAFNLVKGKVKCERVFLHAIAKYQIPQRSAEQQKRVESLHEVIGVGEPMNEFFSLYEELPPDHKDLATRWTDFYQQTLLYRATSCENMEAIRFMLAKSPNQPLHNLDTNETPVLIACRKNLHEIAQLLLEHSPKLVFISEARNHLNPLHVACSRGDVKMVELLLQTIKLYAHSDEYDRENEISLDFRDELGRTPLYNACYYGFFNVVKLLVEFQQENSYVSMNVNAAVKNTQRTPLHVAARKGSLEIVRLLLSLDDIDVNLEGRPSGRTPGKLIRIYQTNIHGRVIPEKLSKMGESYQEIDGDEGSVEIPKHPSRSSTMSPNMPLSPPGTRSPTPFTEFESTSSLFVRSGSNTPRSSTGSISPGFHIDDSIGFVAPVPSAVESRKHSTGSNSGSHTLTRTISPRPFITAQQKKRVKKTSINEPTLTKLEEESSSSSSEVSFEKKRIRSQTDTNAMEIGESNLRVVEDPKTGKLEIVVKESDLVSSSASGKEFDSIFMTPLAEACACGHTKIMKLLLKHGARDDSGLACRIAFLIQRYDMMRLILGYHTVLKESASPEDDIEEGEPIQNLELHWSYMKLPLCDGEWIGKEGEFYPICKDREKDLDDTGYTGSSGSSSELKPVSNASPQVIVKFDAITMVQMDNNRLQVIPIELFQLQNVQKINLSHNKITKLPTMEEHFSGNSKNEMKGLMGWACPCLTELNVSKNELVSIPLSVWGLPHLSRLLCAKNKISSLLPETGAISDEILSSSIEIVDLSGNHLNGKISQFIFELPSVRILNLSSNRITDLPETIWGCTTLQELNLSDNQLQKLPLCETEHVYSQSLYHSNSGNYAPPVPIQKAGQVLGGRAIIKAVQIDRNKSLYQKAPSTIRALNTAQEVMGNHSIESYEYSSLQKLTLSSNKFSTFPEALPCFAPNLVDLDISRNSHLESIDVQFLPFSLKKLVARNCQITKIGNVISRASHSRVVQNCRHGETAGLACQHRSHLRLPNLTTLDLQGNRITYMQLIRHKQNPESEKENVGTLEQEFDHKVAPALDLLYPSLEGLNLSANKLIGKFNPNIGHQSHLKWIKLGKNHDLTAIPMEFANLKNSRQLTQLEMDDLPNLVEPPAEYKGANLNHLLTYMRSRLKESDYYRSIKLFFIGSGERGKTTLLRRLRALPEDKRVERTAGIDIESWIYPDPKKFTFKEKKKPVQFLAWDFAGQEVYHTTHQCFYSKRSMYLALFRLIDGEKGIEELEPWLRNVQLRAPGCPVIIVGTHLDGLADPNEAKELERKALERYSSSSNYPKVVSALSISCLKRLFGSRMEQLRSLLYTVACHLSLGRDGISLEYKPNMSETDPKALFHQQIPQTFLSLQEKISEKVREMKSEGKAPIMEDTAFRSVFKDLFEDEDELNEAVFFLNLQGTLLHFEDHNLRNVHFLDPQWLAKLMADVIHPAAMGKAAHIHDGVAEISGLFCHRDITPTMKDRYISLLEKFEVALKINASQMIIPSLMPESAMYPKPNDILSDIPSAKLDEIESHYQPPLQRIWLADYVPAGFWPRLICRVATDHQIGKILRTIIGAESQFASPSGSIDSNMDFFASIPHSPSMESTKSSQEILNWTPWKAGMAFSHRGRTLLVMKQVSNIPSDEFLDKWEMKARLLKSKYRIEIHIYTNEWITLSNELMELNQGFYLENFECIPGLATKLLVMITGHVKALALSWFPGMLIFPSGRTFVTHVPCWKCYAEIGSAIFFGAMKGTYICKDDNPISTFILEDQVVTAALDKPLECCLHGYIKIMHMAPDLIFRDLTSDVSYQDSNAPLQICEDEVLGKGGFGFVCKGELTTSSAVANQGGKKNVAVKIFLENVSDLLSSASISELLELSKEPKHLLYAYREIRQEVSFLSNLNHPNLTKLCGVRTSPHMCLVLELAPKKSLRAILKEYKECQVALEPLTLKNTALQTAQGLEYLHSNQVVHLDMKSPNILLWHFPSPRDERQVRIRQSGNVWIKIADYGISQVSTGLTLKVDNQPVGTPGFMAPELFNQAGHVVSSEKVDVFAYGMVLYELLSQRSPFDNVQQLKRNAEVKDGRRPTLQAKETRSLILLQDIMELCWEQEPENRPKMSQVSDWIRAPELERLRAEISLGEVKSISCACVCRILPEYEKWGNEPPPLTVREGMKIYNSMEMNLEELQKAKLDEIGNFDSLIEEYGGEEASIDLFVPNMISSTSMESVCIESTKGSRIDNEGEDVYQFLPASRARGSSFRRDKFRSGSLSKSLRRSGSVNVEEPEPGDSNVNVKQFDPYTQVWMCGRDQRKGLLQIFTYNDGHPGHYLFTGYCSREEITSMCPVHNMMWMGTTAGTIKIFHAPTLKTKFTSTLETDESMGATNRTILDILYVEERRTVMVANFSGEVWCFYDKIVEDGLRLQCKISLSDGSPCYHLVKVVLDGGSKVEVWGTMENNRLLVLAKYPGENWKDTQLVVKPNDPKIRLCSYIAFTSFTDSSGDVAEHIWITYRQRSVLVSFNAQTRQQRGILNCAEKLKTETSQAFQITTVVCSGHKVIVGTTIGAIGIFNSENFDLLNFFHWHKEKVRTLLLMPKEAEPCICAEIPFTEHEDEPHKTGRKTLRSEAPGGHSGIRKRNVLTRQKNLLSPKKPNFCPQFSYLDNKYCIPNPEPESVLLTSVGNGKHGYSVNVQSKEEKVKIFDRASQKKSIYKMGKQAWEDIVLLSWRS